MQVQDWLQMNGAEMGEKTVPITDCCLCGAVRYRCLGEPL